MIPVNHHFLQASLANYVAFKNKKNSNSVNHSIRSNTIMTSSNVSPLATIPILNNISVFNGTTGTSLTINGSSFEIGCTVQFYNAQQPNKNATDILRVNGNTITCKVPELVSSGIYTVFVLNSGILGSNKLSFTYTKPNFSITISPNSGTTGTTAILTISVTGSTPFPNISDVKVGTQTVSGSLNRAAKTLTFIVPPLSSAGYVDVQIVTVSQFSNIVSFNYTTVAPTITNITQLLNTNTLTITGTNFVNGFTRVKINAADGTNVVVNGTTSITCRVPGSVISGNVNVKVNCQSKESTINAFAYTRPSLPTITSITQTFGTRNVTITGTNFASEAIVNFGGTIVTTFSSISTTSIAFELPVSVASRGYTVKVTCYDQTSTATNFDYIGTPAITSITQTSGTRNVTITGTNFTSALIPIVQFNVSRGINVVVNTNNYITCQVPQSVVSGSIRVTVTCNDQISNVVYFNYTVPPTIITMSYSITNKKFTITGTNFASGAIINFGGTIVTTFSNISTTSITFVLPDSVASGSLSVTVTCNGQTSNAIIFNYIGKPTITSITQTSGTRNVTIIGTNFARGAIVNFNGVVAESVSFNNTTSISCTVPVSIASGSLSVTVTCNGQTSAATNFNYIATPTITSITQTSGTRNVTIIGANFASGAIVNFNGVVAESVSFNNTTSISCTVPVSLASNIIIATVTCNGQTTGFPFSYTAPNPTITSITQTSGTRNVTIIGANFASGAIVNFGETIVTTFSSISNNSISCTVPASVAYGRVSVTVTCNGRPSNAKIFDFIGRPTITRITQTSGTRNVTITGTNFASGAIVNFNGAVVTTFSSISFTSITFEVPVSLASGSLSVTVTCNGQTSTSKNFDYIGTPVITSITQTSGTRNVTIIGTNFASGATVNFGAVVAESVSLTDTTSISCTVPLSIASGSLSVTVTCNGQTSTSKNFDYIGILTITGIAQTSGTRNVTITGTDFASGAIVNFAGSVVTTFSSISLTSITFEVDVSVASGNYTLITVTCNDRTSNTYSFTYIAPPTITSAKQTSGSTRVTITGTNFASGAIVKFYEFNAESVSINSSTTITCRFPNSLGAGNVFVTVTCDGQTSNAFPFYYTNVPVPTITYISDPFYPNTSINVAFFNASIIIHGTNFTNPALYFFYPYVNNTPLVKMQITQYTSTTINIQNKNTYGSRAFIYVRNDDLLERESNKDISIGLSYDNPDNEI